MNRPVQGLGGALARLDPLHVSWARAAAQRLSQIGLNPAIAPLRAEDGERWYRGPHLAFAPLAPPPLRGAPAKALIAALSAHEALLAEIEAALGIAAEFDTHAPLTEDVPAITLHTNGTALARIAVLAPVAPLPAPSPPVVDHLTCIAARLPMAEAEQLTGGDMLLLDHGPWPLVEAQGSALGLTALGYDPRAGTILRILPAPASQGAPLSMSSDVPPSGLAVPVAIHLADYVVTQDDLARLAETGTFDLGAVSAGLIATLSVGGRRIGQGEIVRLGDRFAVLLETAEASVPSEAPSADATAATDAGPA
jgi:flagellar motor switch/type III secretory pathway protein FliN